MTIDLSAFRRERGSPAPQLLADALDSGRVCSGPEKVAQRFVLQLMTRSGSVPGSDAGCEFVARLVEGKVNTETDVFVAFTSSAATVVRALQAEETAADPAGEKLVGISLERLSLAPGTVTLHVSLRFASGVKVGLEIPLNFLLV